MSSDFTDAHIQRQREVDADIESPLIFAHILETEKKSDNIEKAKEDMDRKSIRESAFPQRGGGLKQNVWMDCTTATEESIAFIKNCLPLHALSSLPEASSI
jgi:hypothetical protein